MFFNRLDKKPSASHKIIKNRKSSNQGLARFARRYALHLGALLALLTFILAYVIEPAKAGVYTRTPSGATLVQGKSLNGNPDTDMDSDDDTVTRFKESAGTNLLEIDIPLDSLTAQASKIYKADLTIDAFINANFDGLNYYAKMFTGATTTDDFAAANLGPFSATDGINDTVTLTETNVAKAQAFYNGGSPKVKIMNAKVYNGTGDSSQSELSIDYLAVTFYEDVTGPTTGSLTPASSSNITGTVAVTLANVQDTESGRQDVVFEYSPNGTDWTSIGTDTTPDGTNNYSVNWDTTTAANGAYQVRATARDNIGNTTVVTSTNLQVDNDTLPPNNVYIITPADGTRVNNPVVSANAQDNVGVTKVEFYSSVNPSTPFATDTDPTGGWTASWNTDALTENQTYQLWVKAFDAVNPPTQSANVSFTVDRTAPVVQNTDPLDNSTGVTSNSPSISATFNETIDNLSIIAGSTFKVTRDGAGENIPGNVTIDEVTNTVTFTPSGLLAAPEWFTARLTTGVKDEAGNPLAADYTWRFQTADDTSPVVQSITPGDSALLKREIREITAVATDNAGVTKVEFYWQAVGSGTWTLFGTDTTAGDGWKANLDTTAFNEGQYDIRALAYDGTNSPGQLIVRYTVDATLPWVIITDPLDGATGTGIRPTVRTTFSEDMDTASFTYSSFYLTEFGSPGLISTNLSYDAVAKTANLTLPAGQSLTPETTYTAHMTTSVKDLAGNSLDAEKTWNFTTYVDMTPPGVTITGVSPDIISPQNVDGNKDYSTLTYNLGEDADVHLEVFDSVGSKVYDSPTGFFTAGNGLTLTWNGLDNSAQFVPDGSYTLKVVAVDSGSNVTGKTAGTKVRVDNNSPSLRQAAPENRTKVQLTFSEPVDINSATNEFFYQIYEQNNPANTLNITGITMVGANAVRIQTSNRQKTDGTIYTLEVSSVEDLQGNVIQGSSTVDFIGYNPHGKYGPETSMCSSCHITHNAQGGRLINGLAVKDNCYFCHKTGGQSTFDSVYDDFQKTSHHPVELPVSGSGLISCNDCHNVHGDKITTETIYPKLLRAENIGSGQVSYSGNEYCWACHGSNSTLPGPNGDHQSYYPASGSAHNSASFDPASGTGVKCTKCHASHGSDLPKLLQMDVNGNMITGNNKTQCYSCHQDAGSHADWDGQSVYDDVYNKHKSLNCVNCHNPHSQQYQNFLKNTYDTNASQDRTRDYTPGDYETCRSCHADQIDTKFLQTTKNADNTTPTGFWDDAGTRNLHKLHLKDNGDQGKGYAVCSECHRPHGPRATSENPSGKKQIGFPAATVTPKDFAGPVYTRAGNDQGGSCNLTCHGRGHNDPVTYGYDNGGSVASGGNTDTNCYSCHASGGSAPDIQSLMGDNLNPPAGINSRHIVSNVDTDLAGGNGCLAKCHDKHSSFDTSGKASNTLYMTWDDVNKIQSDDKLLCQNCHKTTPTSGAAAIDDNFHMTAHSYEETYHDYGFSTGGTFKGNCLKCHNPHGKDNYKLLDLENQGNSFGRDSSLITNQGRDNSVCIACHTNFRIATANWPGTTLYNHAGNAHGSNNLTGSDPANGYCISCHDPHGKTDGSGPIPEFLRERGTAVCNTCHNGTSSTLPGWPGQTDYDAGAHKTYAADGSHGTGYCENCHAVHGKDDGAGAPVPELLAAKEEASCFGGGTGCHGVGGINPANGNKNIDIKTIFDRADPNYKHGDLYASDQHSSTEKTTAGPGWLPGTNRHAECEDCHNSHAAKATSSPATLSDGKVKDSGVGVWGITLKDGGGSPIADPSDPALWPALNPGDPKTAPANADIVKTDNADKEWQVCAKCHSAWAYGSSKPAATKWDGTSDPAGQTDVLADFNPNNLGHHAVIAQGNNQPGAANPNFANTFVSPRWGPGARLACSDCHSSGTAGDPQGPHGSNYRYLLVGNTSGSGDPAVFCLNCHKQSVYGDPATSSPPNASYSRFSHPANGNHIIASSSGSNNHASRIWCLNCHMGDSTGGSHGSNKGPGPNTKSGYTNQPLGRRLMNGGAMASFNTTTGGIACYSQGSATSLSACQKGHGGQAASTNYDY